MGKIKMLLGKVKHPEINNSLVELGMIGDIQEEAKKVIVELKLPMLGVPIREQLINLIKDGLRDFEVEVKVSLMSDEERENFFKLSHKNWAL